MGPTWGPQDRSTLTPSHSLAPPLAKNMDNIFKLYFEAYQEMKVNYMKSL